MKTIATSIFVFALATTVARAQLQPSTAGFKIRRSPTFSPQGTGGAKQQATGTQRSRQKPPRIFQYRPGTFPIRPRPATRTFPTTVRALVYVQDPGAPASAGYLEVTIYRLLNKTRQKIQSRRIPVQAGERRTWSVVFSGLPSGKDLIVRAELMTRWNGPNTPSHHIVSGISKEFNLWPQASATVTVPMKVDVLVR